MKKVKKKDDNGNEYIDIEFDTSAFGTFFDVSIEEIDGIEYIIASCEIWKRFSKACDVIVKRIEEGTLHTSWEIAVEEKYSKIIDGLMTSVIKIGRFIGHCLLGSDVDPAFKSSKLIEMASDSGFDFEVAEALSNDILDENNKELEGNIKLSKEKLNVNVSQLTECDLHNSLTEICSKELKKWCYIAFHFPIEKEIWLKGDCVDKSLDYIRIFYNVDENDNITIGDPEKITLKADVKEMDIKISELEEEISEKNDEIIKTCEEVTRLKEENSALIPFKEKFERAEQDRIENEIKLKKESLVASITKSGLITVDEISESEELSAYVNSLDEKSLKAILADRYIASLDKDLNCKKNAKVDVSEKKKDDVSMNLSNSDNDDVLNAKDIVNKFIKGI